MPYYCNINACRVPHFIRERELFAHQWQVHKVAGLFICGKLYGAQNAKNLQDFWRFWRQIFLQA